MSELYSIKKETLTDIGDALRRRHGNTEWVETIVPITKVSKTQNATGFDSWSGMCESRNSSFYKIITIDGANTIKVKMAYHLYKGSSGDDISDWNQYVYVASGSHDAITFPSDALVYTGTGTDGSVPINIVELEFPGTNTITFYWRGCASSADEGNFLGYYAEVTGFNENGEVLTESGEVEIPRVYTSAEMAGAINDIPPAPSAEAFLITEDCSNAFYGGRWDWFIENYGDKITTKDITKANYMFHSSNIENIPFAINFNQDRSYHETPYMFCGCAKLKTIPKLNGCKVFNLNYIFHGCQNIREFPEDIADWFDWSYIDTLTNAYSGNQARMFERCSSLRSVPIGMLCHGNPNSGYNYAYFGGSFNDCYVLDELVDLPIPYTKATWTSNAFTNMGSYRLKNLTFAMPDGQPYVMNWKSQVIDLSSYKGYMTDTSANLEKILNFNSGITADKEVKDDESYARLKDDPDWFTCNVAYSRYNHDSAVATINSLPDTSAYLAAKGGTNTIKFNGAAGSATDGGAINTLTEEEIAVATAKGWTVTLS